ncbi:hypothetical protein CBS101457_002573 [Exobasidium rhododendri]|nr:hypothetical protein CBS101457_002573 [Exobasidium rhododendri]
MAGASNGSIAIASSSTSAHVSSSSKYPLVSFSPSTSIPRLPYYTPDDPNGRAFAEEQKDGSILNNSKSLFKQAQKVVTIGIPARETARYQQNPLLKDSILKVHKLKSLYSDPNDRTRNLLQLNVEKVMDLPRDTQQLIEDSQLPTSESSVVVEYDYWTADEVLSSLLPIGELPEGTPTAFTTTGHIAHVNLRDEYAPYKYLIGQVILEKNNQIRTVVNKLDSIDNEFRFFKMEKLAGDDDYVVTVSESDCQFTFDFRTVYWNSRLHSEHERLINSFHPYDVISDVMAGVGPFAVPAAKKGVYVLANDLNPASYESMVSNRSKNKVEDNLRCYCEDGRLYIQESIRRCWNQPWEGKPTTQEACKLDLASKTAKGRAKQTHQKHKGVEASPIERGPSRRLINHFVMNLPGSALEFLDAFPGAYHDIAGDELEEEMKRDGAQWPMVHVHCFTKDIDHPHEDICRRANERLGLTGVDCLVPPPSSLPDSSAGRTTPPSTKAHDKDSTTPDMTSLTLNSSSTPDVHLHYVRSVAPSKDMYCLSFRLTRKILMG